eukprot:GHVO01045119.1.p1 GENE.GHVO01045119.1~~GHVO01045119.1.p1  ORF type:complete len:229 (-),score=37.94 GHVO01045119.1:324-1010(-)
MNNTDANLWCIVNPVNPTGRFRPLADLKKAIEETCKEDTTVIVDESMQPWIGDNWRDESLVSQSDWISELSRTKRIDVYVLHSWTKIWSCPGLRIGSVIAPSTEHANMLRSKLVPWSMNSCAVAFLNAACQDVEYMKSTWLLTAKWRAYAVGALSRARPDWTFHGQPWLSYIWIDTHSETTSKEFADKCKLRGVPIRLGSIGYGCATYVRIAVRKPEHADIVIACAKQ